MATISGFSDPTSFFSINAQGQVVLANDLIVTPHNIECNTITAHSEIIVETTIVTGDVKAEGDVYSNWDPDTSTGNSLNTLTSTVGGFSSDITSLNTKTQNIVTATTSATTMENRLNLRDGDEVIRVVIDPDGISDANEVIATSTGQSVSTSLLKTDGLIARTGGGDISVSSNFSALDITGNLGVETDLRVDGHTSLNTLTIFNSVNPFVVRNSDDTKNLLVADPVTNEILIGDDTIQATIRFPYSDATLSYDELDIPNVTAGTIDFTSTLNSVTPTTFGYLDATSSIQTQLNGKQAANSNLDTLTTSTTGDIIYSSASNTLAKLAIGSEDEVLTVKSGIPSWEPVSGGSFNPTITSAASSDMILYNSVSTNWENALVPWKAMPTITASGNLLTVTAPTYVLANVNTSSYDAQLASDSGFTTILNTWTAQVSNQFDTTAYVTDGNTYYFRARANTDWGSRKTQYTTGTSFVAAAYHSPVAAWGWLDASAASRDPSGYDGDTNVSGVKTTTVWNGSSGQRGAGTWYSGLGQQWSQAQVSTVAIGQADSLGTQAISGNPSYTFTSVDGMALNIGSTRSYLVFDLGSAKSCAKWTVRAQYTSTPGGWTPIDSYFKDQILEYWNGSSWVNLTTFSGTYTSGQVITATFSTQNIRYYRLGSNTSNRYAIATQVALSAV